VKCAGWKVQVKLEVLGNREGEPGAGLAAGEGTLVAKIKVKIHLIDLRLAYYIVKYSLRQS
jgi:hypothetical protein